MRHIKESVTIGGQPRTNVAYLEQLFLDNAFFRTNNSTVFTDNLNYLKDIILTLVQIKITISKPLSGPECKFKALQTPSK